MKIWAHTLVKNEERYLWYALKSVINHVDKILLWDTGSTDNTIEICEYFKKKYPTKISFKRLKGVSAESFPKVRQMMLDETSSGWFLVLDGDEVWWEDSIKKVVSKIKKDGEKIESVVVPTFNVVGDVYHYQDQNTGKYTLAGKTGHFALRAIKRSIPELSSKNPHGTWGWVDGRGKMIQDRNPKKIAFIDAPYMHFTNVPRSSTREEDLKVIKRKKKLKYEIGKTFPSDFYYPEALFVKKPDFIPSPWEVITNYYKVRAYLETPLKKIKRKFEYGKVGY